MKSILRLLLVFGLFLSSGLVKATHISGGDFRYTCVGADSFKIELYLFRDCSGVSAPTSASVTFTSSCGGTVNATLALQNPGGTEVSQLCPTAINNSSCNGGSLPGMQQYIYEAIVVLSPPCNSWTMSWSSCCRNNPTNLSGGLSAGTYISAQMNSLTDSCNNSPKFTAQPIPYVCQNQIVNYNFGVVEPDGDSITYTLVPALTGATTPVNYGTGYSAIQPFNNTVPITLDPATGQLTFNPPSLGIYVVVVRVDEYDSQGNHLGYIFRDIQIVVQPCNNTVPSVGGIQNFTGTGLQIDSNSVEVCVGNTMNFDIFINDPDTADTVNIITNIQQALGPTATVTITSGNPAKISISWTATTGNGNFVSFSVTGVDDACNVSGISTAAFDITIVPSTYAGPDQTICLGSQSANINTVGGTSFNWVVISGDPIIVGSNFSCDTCANVTASPNITTVYEVTSNLSGTCKNKDTIKIEVVPDFNLTVPADTTVCSVDDFQLFANTDQPFTYSYLWKPTASLNNDTIANPLANPSQPTTYTVTVTSAAGCQKTASVNIGLSPPFPDSNFVTGDTVLCLGSGTQLGINFGKTTYSYCGISTMGCLGANVDGTIGAGTQTNTSSSYPAIFAGARRSAKHQILYYASELQAMGMQNGGQINSIAFDIGTVGAVTTFNDFTVKLKCTNSSDLAGGWEFGMVEVVPAFNHTVTSGWNVFNLPTPYYWDGTSNLVVEVCFNNPAFIFNTNSQQKFTATLNQTVRYNTSTSQSVCSNFGNSLTSTERPNLKINFCTGTNPSALTFNWSPNTAISNTGVVNPNVNPTSPTTYQVIIKDTVGGCSDTINHFVDVVTQFNAGFNFNDPLCVSATPDTASPNVGGGTFSGTGIVDANNGVFDPSVAGVGTHAIQYSITGSCANDSTINVTVIALPDASINAPDDYCASGAPLALTAVNPGGVFSGQGVTGSTFNPSGLSAGTYEIYHKLTTPCPNIDTHKIKLVDPYKLSLQNNITVCDNDTLILNGSYTLLTGPTYGNGPVNVTFNGTGITDTVQGHFNGNGLTAGTYPIVVSVADTFGNCGSVDTLKVKVNATEYAALIKDRYCDSQSNEFLQINKPNTTWSNLPVDTSKDSIKLNSQNKFNPKSYGNGKWVFTFSYTNSNKCTGISTDTLYIDHTPVDPNPFSTNFCQNQQVILESSFENADSLIWVHNTTDTTNIGTGSPMSTYGNAPDPANGKVTVFVREVNGACKSDFVEYELPIKPSPSAFFRVSYKDTNGVVVSDSLAHVVDTFYVNQPATVWVKTLHKSLKDSIAWDLNYQDLSGHGDVIINSQGNVPVLPQDFRSPGTYKLLLVYTNEFGCADSAYAFLEVIGQELVPNVFTPNGDGVNDLFYVIAPVRDFDVTIFNRWGREVYKYNCNQCSQKDKGWDGSGHADGTYYFIVTGKHNDGSPYVQKGTVTLTGGN